MPAAERPRRPLAILTADDEEGLELFFTGPAGNRMERDTCSWHGEARGLRGSDWWIELPFKWQQRWPRLRTVAMKGLSQTSTESAAERHFSAVEIIQPKVRATLSPQSIQKRAFVRAEIHGTIARDAAKMVALLTPEDLDRHETSGRPDDVYHPRN